MKNYLKKLKLLIYNQNFFSEDTIVIKNCFQLSKFKKYDWIPSQIKKLIN